MYMRYECKQTGSGPRRTGLTLLVQVDASDILDKATEIVKDNGFSDGAWSRSRSGHLGARLVAAVCVEKCR